MVTIGQYWLGELLGAGGGGQVHAAFDTVLKRDVAIKSLRPELLRDGNFVDRFRAEATSLARLNHSNITTIHTFFEEKGGLYLVMELVRGDTLERLLKKRGGPLPMREALAIGAQAADGLAYAHSMGVIHRDIKPANLMVTRAGTVKLMDFGIARMHGSQRLTRDGSMVGTLAYMSPEQLRGEPGDERSDLYSLAIVLYEMLCGAAPFESKSDYELMRAQIHKKPRRPSLVVPDVEPGLETALLRALAKNPADRFASVGKFKQTLEHPSNGACQAEREGHVENGEGSRTSRLADALGRFLPAAAGMRMAVLLALGAGLLATGTAAFLWQVRAGAGPQPAVPTLASGAASHPSRSSGGDTGQSVILPPTRDTSSPPIIMPRR